MIFNRLAEFDQIRGNMQKALDYCHTAIILAEQASDLTMQSRVLYTLSLIQAHQGNFQLSILTAHQSQLLAKSTGDCDREAGALVRQGRMYLELGNYKQASLLFIEADVLYSAIGLELYSEARQIVMNHQAEVYFRKTEYADAHKINLALLEMGSKTLAFVHSWPYAVLNIALINIATKSQSCDILLQDIDRASQKFSKGQDTHGLAGCDYARGMIHLQMGHINNASSFLQKTLSDIQGKFADIEMMCIAGLSDVFSHGKNPDACIHATVCYFAFAWKTRSLEATYHALQRLGDIHIQNYKDSETAYTLFLLALDGFTLMDIHKARGDCMIRIGDILHGKGQVEEARVLWQAARSLFTCSSQIEEVSNCDQRLNVCEDLELAKVHM